MSNAFDSRALGFTDCYGQRFMKPGVYRYNVLVPGAHCMTEDRPFAIRVEDREKEGRMTQHNIVVRAVRAGFEVDRPELSIDAGDLVLWNCADRRALPYAVVGDKPFFRSDRLLNESGYSHAFGLAGEYRWRDAHGSEAGGTVRVRQPDCRHEEDCGRWLQSLSKGALVMIGDGRVEPREVEIALGQTVFFAVARGPGISITDERLLGGDHQDHGRKRGAA